MQRFGNELERSILAIHTAEPCLRFATDTGLQNAPPIIRYPADALGMDGDGPAPPHSLRLCQTGVLAPPLVQYSAAPSEFASHTSAGMVSMTARSWSEMFEW